MNQSDVAAFVEENMKTIYAYALSRVSDKEDAKDLTSDIIVAIMESTHRIKNDNAFYGYVWQIASNTYKKYLQNKKRIFVELEEEALILDEDVLSNLCYEEEVNILRRELTLLAKEYRECTVAYYFEGKRCSQIATEFGISKDMVKYYLFKTRKILKEGIGMVREFGEKSYKPGVFHFHTIFAELYNPLYCKLFQRKLPGNILLSAYYSPVTIQELSMELGVSAVYLEDELKVLRDHALLKEVQGNKYQTNIIIYTRPYKEELRKAIEQTGSDGIKKIVGMQRSLLGQVKELGFKGYDSTDNHLLWVMTVCSIFQGKKRFDHNVALQYLEIYPGAHGISFGYDYEEPSDEDLSFAGFLGNYGNVQYSYINFRGLGRSNLSCDDRKKILTGDAPKEIIIFPKDTYELLLQIIEPIIQTIAELYRELAEISISIMEEHIPDGLKDQARQLISLNIFYEMMGFLGEKLMEHGLTKPHNDEKITVFGVEG